MESNVLSSFGPTDTALIHLARLSDNLSQPVFTEDYKLIGECRKKEVKVITLSEILSLWQENGSK